MSSSQECIYSPCIRKCCLDNDDICLGCFRALNEIIVWTQLDEKTRLQLLEKAKIRQQQRKNSNCF
jgi:uncharacterized protein